MDIGLSKAFYFLSFIPVIIICCWYGKNVHLGILKSAIYVAVVYVVNFGLMLLLAWIEAGFKGFGAQNGIRSFSYTPLLCFLAAKAFKMDWRHGGAIFALCLPFSHAVAHIGCIFPGCCEGYPCSWGIYNAFLQQNLFPVQLLESIVASLVGIHIFFRIKKRKFLVDGKEYPIMMLLFGSTRFVCEFFRANIKIWIGCSSLSFHALFMCVVGLIWLAVLNNKEQKKHKIV